MPEAQPRATSFARISGVTHAGLESNLLSASWNPDGHLTAEGATPDATCFSGAWTGGGTVVEVTFEDAVWFAGIVIVLLAGTVIVLLVGTVKVLLVGTVIVLLAGIVMVPFAVLITVAFAPMFICADMGALVPFVAFVAAAPPGVYTSPGLHGWSPHILMLGFVAVPGVPPPGGAIPTWALARP